REWKIKAGKAMFMLKATIQKEMLDLIREAKTPEEAWDAFATLFAEINVARLQMLENEIGSITQDNMTISQYFMKVKGICNDIGQLDVESKISDARKRQIIICGLKPKYNGFITAIQGWHVQPSLLELESLLANQESLAKQMAGVSMKPNEEVLFTGKGYKQKPRTGQGSSQGMEASKNGESPKKSWTVMHLRKR
ncbi:UBN2 domain-containing protein, partial [Cephalotus follicularis]